MFVDFRAAALRTLSVFSLIVAVASADSVVEQFRAAHKALAGGARAEVSLRVFNAIARTSLLHQVQQLVV